MAYAAVVYLKSTTREKTEVSFVMAKSRLTPKADQDELKIPKLELLGVLIGSRLIKYVEAALNLQIHKEVLWTDSQVVLHWINSTKLLPPFVTRRIKEVKQNTKLVFRYVRSTDNPADVATRTEQNPDKDKWIKGPDFLKSNEYLVNQPEHVTTAVGVLKTNKKIKEHQIPKEINITGKESIEEIELIKKIQKENYLQECNNVMTDLARTLRLVKDSNDILRCKGRL